MMDWLNQREPRERVILVTGAILAIVIVGWSFVWTPLRDGAVELDESVAERARQVVDLKRAASLTALSASSAAVADGQSLVVVIDETARPLGLATAFTRSNVDGDAINVNFRDARFDSLISWFIDLERRHGLAVVTLSVSRSGEAGLVSGQVRLDRS